MPRLILAVQPTGSGSYRLGISNEDSNQYFVHRKRIVFIETSDNTFETHTTCGPPLPKGFDLYSKEINSWIQENKFHVYPKGKPTKLEFDLSREGNRIVINLYRQVITSVPSVRVSHFNSFCLP